MYYLIILGLLSFIFLNFTMYIFNNIDNSPSHFLFYIKLFLLVCFLAFLFYIIALHRLKGSSKANTRYWDDFKKNSSPYVTIKKDGTITFANQAAKKMLQIYEGSDNFSNFFHKEDVKTGKYYHRLGMIDQNLSPKNYVVRLNKKDNKSIHALISTDKVLNSSTSFYITNVTSTSFF